MFSRSCLLLLAFALVGTHAATLTYVERGGSDQRVPSGLPSGLGDYTVFNNDLYDEENQSIVGKHDGTCTLVNDLERWFCVWNVLMPDEQNKLFLHGTIFDAEDRTAVVGVVGGSGRFFGAQGEATVVSHGEFLGGATTTWTFSLDYELLDSNDAATSLVAALGGGVLAALMCVLAM